MCELLTRKISERVNLPNPVVLVEFKRCRFSPRMLNISQVDIATEHGRSENDSFSCKFVIFFKTLLVQTRLNIMNVHDCRFLLRQILMTDVNTPPSIPVKRIWLCIEEMRLPCDR